MKTRYKISAENCYIFVGNSTLRQAIGIPAVSDPSLLMANLHKACSFAHLLTNLCAINSNSLFEKHFKEIYPNKLDLKKENISNTKALFFDINLDIKDNKTSLNFMIKVNFSDLN